MPKKMKPCPFCGGGCCTCTSGWQGKNNEYPGWIAHCKDCDCTIGADKNGNKFKNRDEAIRAWNTRLIYDGDKWET